MAIGYRRMQSKGPSRLLQLAASTHAIPAYEKWGFVQQEPQFRNMA
jgi:hypothetical protein